MYDRYMLSGSTLLPSINVRLQGEDVLKTTIMSRAMVILETETANIL